MSNVVRPKSGLYMLPNLITTAGLFASFYSIVAALKGQFETAVIALFIAMIMDLFDGRVARMTQTESEFGAQYDSLCDMVSFGVAPPLILYSWSLHHLGKIGWLAAFVYASCTALRLARFNVASLVECKKYFQGLPCPPAAGIMVALVWNDYHTLIWVNDWLMLAMTVIVALLMVSNISYFGFKQLEFKGRLPFIIGVFNVLLFSSIALDPPMVLLLFFMLYGLSGPFLTLFRYYQAWSLRRMRLNKP